MKAEIEDQKKEMTDKLKQIDGLNKTLHKQQTIIRELIEARAKQHELF